MQSAPPTVASLLDQTLPHEQFSSRIAFNGELAASTLYGVSVRPRFNSLPNRKNSKLPPLSRIDSSPKGIENREGVIFIKNCESKTDKDIRVPNTKSGVVVSNCESQAKIEQLEKNLEFVNKHNKKILKCLHNELEDLKWKNRGKFHLI